MYYLLIFFGWKNLFPVVGYLGGRAAPQTILLFPEGCRPWTPATFSLQLWTILEVENGFIWKSSGSETSLNRLGSKNHV